eukprot:gene4361-3172_t
MRYAVRRFRPLVATSWIFCAGARGYAATSENLLEINQDAAEAFKEGDYMGAIELWGKVAAFHDPTSPSTAVSLIHCWGNLAWAYRSVGDTKNELEILQKSEKVVMGMCGPRHPQSIQVLYRLAEALEDIGDYEKMQRTVMHSLDILGAPHRSSKSDTKRSRFLLLLSRVHECLGDKQLQLQKAEEGYSLVRQHYSATHTLTTSAQLVVAKAKGCNGRIDEWLQMAVKAYEIQQSQLGRLNGQVAVTAMSVAEAYEAKAEWGQAKYYLEESMEAQRRAMEAVIPVRLVETTLRLGDVLEHASHHAAALKCYLDAVAKAQRYLAEYSAVQGQALTKVGKSYSLQGDKSGATDVFQKALKVLNKSGILHSHPTYQELNAAMQLC